MQDNEKLAAGAASDLNNELDEEIKMNYCYKHGQCLADDELIALGIQSDKDKIALLVDALKDARSALLYVREAHGELYGVGFDRVEKKQVQHYSLWLRQSQILGYTQELKAYAKNSSKKLIICN